MTRTTVAARFRTNSGGNTGSELRGTVLVDVSLLLTHRFRDILHREGSPGGTLVASPTALRRLAEGGATDLGAYRAPFHSISSAFAPAAHLVRESGPAILNESPDQAVAIESLQALERGSVLAARRWPIIEQLIALGITVELRSTTGLDAVEHNFGHLSDENMRWLEALNRRTRFWLRARSGRIEAFDSGRRGYY